MLQENGFDLSNLRNNIRDHYTCDEDQALDRLIAYLDLSEESRQQITEQATDFVRTLRRQATPGMMETFLSEYGLSTEEGVALMCLAEALLRVPDEHTIDTLIHDKIAPANWSKHLGHSTSPLVNVSTWALMLTGKVISLEERESWDVVANVRQLIKRAGEPVIRKAVGQAMRTLGHQFVLGRSIEEAVERASKMEEKGYTYSYDMLGEAARTAEDASKYFLAYSKAISTLADAAKHSDVQDNPGISIKLSALHPRYEYRQKSRVMNELVPRVVSLAMQAKNAKMGFNIDAEEADRLDLSLDVIEAVLSVEDLAGWDGFGVVVQAYGPRAFHVIDWCYQLADKLDRKIMLRLVKGAYWDTEIKNAQVEAFDAYPVFTRKSATDVSYMACAKKLLSMQDRIYPQFATHNAHTVMSILALADEGANFEFQRLHGMGEALHGLAKDQFESRCRIYAPVGVHEDLLAYLVRRLLENGANSSFVNQVFDEKVPVKQVVRDPVDLLIKSRKDGVAVIPLPAKMFGDKRVNSNGLNFANPHALAGYQDYYAEISKKEWHFDSLGSEARAEVRNPSNRKELVGSVSLADTAVIKHAFDVAKEGQPNWESVGFAKRSEILNRIADLYEENRNELMVLLQREAGKTQIDALNEVREAIDFCRFYAFEAKALAESEFTARGVFICISPWNFPLAIFTGQIVAALVAGNSVLCKPAPQTPLVASRAVELMYEAGIPSDILRLFAGGVETGIALTSLSGIGGVCFTGSTVTAKSIDLLLAENGNQSAPLIAETGGINAMIVDSTALPEQAVRDIVDSAFQSAGQRCSALRVLYVQEDVYETVKTMLIGAMDELVIGPSSDLATDVGPLIDETAFKSISQYVGEMSEKGRLIKQIEVADPLLEQGHFIGPALLEVKGITEIEKEVFGPILHLARFKAEQLEGVLEEINSSGFGLTLGLHTRVDQRVDQISETACVGNLYVNRNQIGAVVGVQPFGGEGMSGTGPKAGGPHYLKKFVKPFVSTSPAETRMTALQMSSEICAGPTGESNILSILPRGRIWISGVNLRADALVALATGNIVLTCDENSEMELKSLGDKAEFAGRIEFAGSQEEIHQMIREGQVDAYCFSIPDLEEVARLRHQISELSEMVLPYLGSGRGWEEFVKERCLSVDTTASGGNAALLAKSSE